MKLRNTFIFVLFYIFIFLLLSIEGHAQQFKEVNVDDIVRKIEKGEDIYLENVSRSYVTNIEI